MVPIVFFVAGAPKTAGSKKAFYNPKLGRTMIVDDAKNRDWKNACARAAAEAHQAPPLAGPVLLTIVFQFLRPRSHFGTGRNAGVLRMGAPKAPAVKPDLTKLTRCLEDSLKGIVWRDDAQVVEQRTRKVYADKLGALVEIGVPDWCGLLELPQPEMAGLVEAMGDRIQAQAECLARSAERHSPGLFADGETR